MRISDWSSDVCSSDLYHTASPDDVGGDFYDLFPLSPNTWGFFLGDVAGKGVDAAVVPTLTRYVLRSAAVFADAPVQVLHNLNTVLNQQLKSEARRHGKGGVSTCRSRWSP